MTMLGKSLSKVSDSVVISHSGAKLAEVIVMSIIDLFVLEGVRSVGLPLFIMPLFIRITFTSVMLRSTLPGRSDLKHLQEV